MSNGEKVKLNVRVSERVKEEAHVMAIRAGVPLQDLVETALLEYMERQTHEAMFQQPDFKAMAGKE